MADSEVVEERATYFPNDLFSDSALEAVAIRNGLSPGDVAAAAILRGAEHTFAQRMITAPDFAATPVPEPATVVLLDFWTRLLLQRGQRGVVR